jgi:hypothetical protein
VKSYQYKHHKKYNITAIISSVIKNFKYIGMYKLYIHVAVCASRSIILCTKILAFARSFSLIVLYIISMHGQLSTN